MAGWTIPAPLAARFASGGSHLERYASRFDAVEINSSFHRPHRHTTYARWAASAPEGFRFAVKLPRTITHDRRLRDCGDLLERFAGEVAGLGGKRGPVLVQLPPSLDFEASIVRRFLTAARTMLDGAIVCEPRHGSWFGAEADALLTEHRVSRVAADPPVTPAGALPGGWPGICYFRLHGAPRTYRSDYPAAAIARHAAQVGRLLAAGSEVWTVFDNTAAGLAPANALALLDHLR